MQTIATFIVLAGAILYVVWRLSRLFCGKEDPCEGCDLKKNCRKFGQYKEK